MKKLLMALIVIAIASSVCFGVSKTTDIKTFSLVTNEVKTMPSSGVYQNIGAKTLTLTTTCTDATNLIYYYLSNGKTSLGSVSLTSGTAVALKSPFYKVTITAASVQSAKVGLIYVTDN